ncbi:MAG: class I SAM-dependent methyltransferase [Chloroflexi bacterium]|nr:class I SAM-dependent methyltransferase [Chloroflexota bacterium]
MYDDFSANYDRFVDWSARLATELPFIERELQSVRARRVLDAACGTGMHTIALARRGYEAVGADLSVGMIARAQANADAADIDVRFETAGFGELARTFAPGNFDALLCLGNSLPHLLTPAALSSALADFAACLRPGGLLLIQNRNFDAVMARGERWMEPQSHREGKAEWLFLRFYDFEPDGTLTFNLATLRREEAGAWAQHVTSTRLRPLRQTELAAAVQEAGFDHVTCYGDMTGAPFGSTHSPNLIVTARP